MCIMLVYAHNIICRQEGGEGRSRGSLTSWFMNSACLSVNIKTKCVYVTKCVICDQLWYACIYTCAVHAYLTRHTLCVVHTHTH